VAAHRLQSCAAALAIVEELARISRHAFHGAMSAVRTCDDAFGLHIRLIAAKTAAIGLSWAGHFGQSQSRVCRGLPGLNDSRLFPSAASTSVRLPPRGFCVRQASRARVDAWALNLLS
jgi:hypothetical protein